ncbi:23S rRNA (guanosine(2251)-2'-O)-methyltransferase RlmB [uncultured Alsobacter sp.]|uniref:23S rRNA (guanosine(2251)-2'-O)-methyltransferase RlmB n=1 Tax=uncultured Alsobacter sp. TaxID=1748258 RepID=UPI0025EB5DB4|nr:23S rRNA (guanosine(2251)-2'-O)-methyltransferase RlmB [uncultured Alsobacter sp.]
MARRQGPGGQGQSGKGQTGKGEGGHGSRGWDPREADRPRREHPRREAPAQEAPRRTGRPLLYGFHAVAEALRNPRRVVHRLFATANAAERLAEMVPVSRVPTTTATGPDLDRLVGPDTVHQGVVAEVDNLPSLDIHDLPDDGLVLVLDQVTDPHNVGAILRSAAAFGVTAVIVTDRHSPEATGVLAKTASGGLEHVPLVTVGNLAQALTLLGERGYWRVGLDSEGSVALEGAVARPPVALVLGAEGKGLRRLTRERCDVLARLDVPGAIKSLNVSNAAAVSLYAVGKALGRF